MTFFAAKSRKWCWNPWLGQLHRGGQSLLFYCFWMLQEHKKSLNCFTSPSADVKRQLTLIGTVVRSGLSTRLAYLPRWKLELINHFVSISVMNKSWNQDVRIYSRVVSNFAFSFPSVARFVLSFTTIYSSFAPPFEASSQEMGWSVTRWQRRIESWMDPKNFEGKATGSVVNIILARNVCAFVRAHNWLSVLENNRFGTIIVSLLFPIWTITVSLHSLRDKRALKRTREIRRSCGW